MSARAAGDVAAERADRLRQRADLDVHAAVHAEVIDGAAAVAAEHAARVRVVHHHDRSRTPRRASHSSGSGAEVAVHAEHAVGDEQLALRRAAARAGCARAASTSLCGKTLIAARLSRQPSMMLAWFSSSEMMTSSFVEDRRHGAGVGGEAALEHDGRLGLLELGEPALELHVDRHRAGDRAHRARCRRRSARSPRAPARAAADASSGPR